MPAEVEDEVEEGEEAMIRETPNDSKDSSLTASGNVRRPPTHASVHLTFQPR